MSASNIVSTTLAFRFSYTIQSATPPRNIEETHAPPGATSRSPPPPHTALHTLPPSSPLPPRPHTPPNVGFPTRTNPQALVGPEEIADKPRLGAPRTRSRSGSTTSVGSRTCRGSARHPGSLMAMAIEIEIGMPVAPLCSTEQIRRSSDPRVLRCSSAPTS